MPTLKIVNGYGKYQDDNALHDTITYILQPWKVPHQIIGGTNVDMNNPVESMVAHAQKFNKYSRTRLRHYIISFEPRYNITLKVLANVAAHISKELGNSYPNVYALHEDKPHYHIHFIVSPIGLNGRRVRGSYDEYKVMLFYLNAILLGFNLGRVVPVKYYPNRLESEE